MKSTTKPYYGGGTITTAEDVTVSDLIKLLSAMPQDAKVQVADSSATYSDEIAIYYDGAHVNLSGE